MFFYNRTMSNLDCKSYIPSLSDSASISLSLSDTNLMQYLTVFDRNREYELSNFITNLPGNGAFHVPINVPSLASTFLGSKSTIGSPSSLFRYADTITFLSFTAIKYAIIDPASVMTSLHSLHVRAGIVIDTASSTFSLFSLTKFNFEESKEPFKKSGTWSSSTSTKSLNLPDSGVLHVHNM